MPDVETIVTEEDGLSTVRSPIKYKLVKPRDQTGDATQHMRYAASLNLKRLQFKNQPPGSKAIIAGGGPSITKQLDHIKALKAQPNTYLFAINWAHTWLINHGVIPDACVMFEIDTDPYGIAYASNPGITYYVCSHCHESTFDGLPKENIVLWHSSPNSEGEKATYLEHFSQDPWIGGGVSTFTRTMPVALALGYRDFALFGCDSSFPDDSATTHVDGYPVYTKPDDDGFYVWGRDSNTGEVRRFRTVGYLSHQVEEFKNFCHQNHHIYKMRVYGDGLLPWVHRQMWAPEYEDEPGQ